MLQARTVIRRDREGSARFGSTRKLSEELPAMVLLMPAPRRDFNGGAGTVCAPRVDQWSMALIQHQQEALILGTVKTAPECYSSIMNSTEWL